MERLVLQSNEDAPDFTQPVSHGISLMPRYVVQRGSSLHSAREDSVCMGQKSVSHQVDDALCSQVWGHSGDKFMVENSEAHLFLCLFTLFSPMTQFSGML